MIESLSSELLFPIIIDCMNIELITKTLINAPILGNNDYATRGLICCFVLLSIHVHPVYHNVICFR